MLNRKDIHPFLVLLAVLLFFLSSCSNLPLIGKKKDEKADKASEGKTVTVEGMETIKGVNPPKPATPPSKKQTVQPPPRKEPETNVASTPARPFYSPSLPFFQLGFKRKIVILDFENKTTYKDEKIGEVVAKRFSDKLEASQRVVTLERIEISDRLNREGFKFQDLTESSAMKQSYRTLGIQAFVPGTVTDVSILSSKASETSEEEVAFATAKVEIRLIDASTGNLLKSFIGRSPIFGTREASCAPGSSNWPRPP